MVKNNGEHFLYSQYLIGQKWMFGNIKMEQIDLPSLYFLTNVNVSKEMELFWQYLNSLT